MTTRLKFVTVFAASLFVVSCSNSSSPDSHQTSTSTTEASLCGFTASERPASREVPLPDEADMPTGKITKTVKTSQGDFTVTLDADSAPCAVKSFLHLAEQNYYDDTICHRTMSNQSVGFLQCGDPTASGQGGPGYTFKDQVKGTEKYTPGVLAMARTSQPNSNGSQFFIVFRESMFNPDYTIFGQVDEAGINLAKKVGDAQLESLKKRVESGEQLTQAEAEKPVIEVKIVGVE